MKSILIFKKITLSLYLIVFLFLSGVTLFAQKVGQPAINFSQNDPNGEGISLASLKGNYVLVDFWASWCGPCVVDIRNNLLPLWKHYKNKNFKILGVSFDRSKESWTGFVEKMGMDWLQVSDLKYWNNAVGKLYNIKYIPQNILVDPEGIIIGKNLKGYALAKKLKDIYGT